MRTFVMGDIHGAHKALLQCLEQAQFDYDTDRLIQLGDVSDRGPETAECVDTLLKIRNLVPLRGNHDCWTHDYFVHSKSPDIWLMQGGRETIISYKQFFDRKNPEGDEQITKELMDQHRRFYEDQLDWYIDEENRLFVHAGWPYERYPGNFEVAASGRIPQGGTVSLECHWDRTLFEDCYDEVPEALEELQAFKEVYIGHTPVEERPYFVLENLYNLDTGVARGNILTMINLETKEVFSSDSIRGLYS